MTRKLLLSLILANLTLSVTAFAADKAVLSTARELAKQELQAYDAGRYDEAVEKLSKAYEVVHVPTLAVNEARALAKLGKLVAASELYLEATRIPKDKSWQSTQEDAQRDAEKERNELLERIPRLRIIVTGVSATEISVSIDGAAVPQALIDAEQLVDLGERHVEGTYGNEAVKESVMVKESDHAQVTLRFPHTSAVATLPMSNVPSQSTKATPPALVLRPSVPRPQASKKAAAAKRRLVG